MIIDTSQIVSITEANQNFSSVAKKVDLKGKVFVMKNNKIRFVVADASENAYLNLNDEEKFLVVAMRILEKHIAAFKELAK